MDIFSNLNLNRNTIDKATLTRAVLGNTSEDIAGGIRYNGTLQYYDGSIWQSVGIGTPTINNVNGLFKIYTSDSYPTTNIGANVVPVKAKYDGELDSEDIGDRLKIQGDGKGRLSLSSHSDDYSISTDIVKITYTNIRIESEVNSFTNYTVGTPFDNDNLLVNTYFASFKENNSYGFFRLVQCDVTIEKTTVSGVDKYKVIVSVNRLPIGLLKVVVFCGNVDTISAAQHDTKDYSNKTNYNQTINTSNNTVTTTERT